MLTMLEVTNNPVVAERLGFTSSAIGSGYSTSLAKVMDVIIHPRHRPPWRSKVAKGYTRDVAKLMGAYADSLENVAAALADIQDPDYSATYGDDDTVTLSLDGAKGTAGVCDGDGIGPQHRRLLPVRSGQRLCHPAGKK